MLNKARIAVLVSGGGTNLEALLNAQEAGALPHGEIVLVLSSNPEAYALERAKRRGVPAIPLSRKQLGQEPFEAALMEALTQYRVDLVVLAGFLSILSADFVRRWPDRIVNVHPSLIPAFCGKGYYGLKVHEAALRRGVRVTGATVHLVNEIPDGGRILLQKAVDILPGDTPETLQRRVMEQAEWVLLPKAEAGCPMAEQLDPEMLRQLQAAYPDYTTVAYINTTAELKTLCDVCVTSSSAVKIIRNMDAEKILFIPDCNLGDYISKQVPEKQFQLIHGGCPTHVRMTRDDVLRARAAHPNALLLVHPECRPQVTEMADFVGSTTEIMHYAENSDAREFIIGTENSIVQHLGISHPEKLFYALSKDCVCHNMKVTTIADVLHCLEGTDGEEILLEESVRLRAKKSIDEMIRLGK